MYRDEEGYILIFVVIILSALGILLPVFLQLTVNEFCIAHNHQEEIKDYYLQEGLEAIIERRVKKDLKAIEESYLTENDLESLATISYQRIKFNGKDIGSYKIIKVIDESSKVNINLASKAELILLPGIGDTLAERIMSYRNNGNFRVVEEINKIYGISIEDKNQFKDKITVNSDGRININTASSIVLQTLSGLGEGLASSITSYRQINGPFSTKSEIMDLSGVGEGRYNGIKDRIKVDSNSFKVEVKIKLVDREAERRRIYIKL